MPTFIHSSDAAMLGKPGSAIPLPTSRPGNRRLNQRQVQASTSPPLATNSGSRAAADRFLPAAQRCSKGGGIDVDQRRRPLHVLRHEVGQVEGAGDISRALRTAILHGAGDVSAGRQSSISGQPKASAGTGALENLTPTEAATDEVRCANAPRPGGKPKTMA